MEKVYGAEVFAKKWEAWVDGVTQFAERPDGTEFKLLRTHYASQVKLKTENCQKKESRVTDETYFADTIGKKKIKKADGRIPTSATRCQFIFLSMGNESLFLCCSNKC